jgi:hypothetical protein
MRTLHSIALILAASSFSVFCAEPTARVGSCFSAFCAEPTARVDAFSKLKQGDTLIVRFHSSGCFHNETHELTFRQASDLSLSIVKMPGVNLGTLTLSKSDIAGLDRLMEFYRSKRSGGCTSVDDITFSQQRDGKTLATEQFTDDSGQDSSIAGITLFRTLIMRLSPPRQ